MRKVKVQEVQIERPEPEGQGDWLYTCTGCGYQRLAGVVFSQPCKKCGGHGWMCHWLKKFGEIPEKSVVIASVPDNNNGKACDKTPDPIGRHDNVLSPLNHTDNVTERGNLKELTPTTGRPEIILPTEEIIQLASQGLGCRAIATKLLEEKGIVVSYRTIQRRLQGSLI